MSRSIRKPDVSQREQPSEDTYMSRLLGITYLGEQPGFVWEGKAIPSMFKLEYTYELLGTQMEDGRPFVVSEEIPEKDWEDKDGSKCSTAVARAKAFCGKDYRDAMLNPEIQLGKPCMVSVTIDKKGYAKVKGQGAVGSVPSVLLDNVAPAENDVFIFNPDEPDMDQWEKMSDFKKGKITQALDFEQTKLNQILSSEYS